MMQDDFDYRVRVEALASAVTWVKEEKLTYGTDAPARTAERVVEVARMFENFLRGTSVLLDVRVNTRAAPADR